MLSIKDLRYNGLELKELILNKLTIKGLKWYKGLGDKCLQDKGSEFKWLD